MGINIRFRALAIVIMATLVLCSGIALQTAHAEPDEALYEEAMKYYDAGDFDNAQSLLKEYVKTNPDPKAYFRIGYSLYKLGRHEEADKFFEQSYLVTPGYSPTPELEKEHDRLKHVRPEGYYGDSIPETGEETPVEVPEGTVAVEEGTTLQIPEVQEADEQAEEAVEQAMTGEAQTAETNAPAQETPAQEAAVQVETKKAVRKATIQEDQIAEFVDKNLIPLAGGVLVFYILHAVLLFLVARKTNVGTPILAFIPLANALALAQAAGKGILFAILIILFTVLSGAGYFALPLAGLENMVANIAAAALFALAWVVRTVLWMFVADNLGKSKIIGLATILPGINLAIMGLLAFTGAAVSAAAGMPDVSGEPVLDLPDVPMDFDDDFSADDDFGADDEAGGGADEPDFSEPDFDDDSF